MKIEKLDSYSTSPDGYYWIQHPTKTDIVDKINEIINFINTSESVCENLLKTALEEAHGN